MLKGNSPIKSECCDENINILKHSTHCPKCGWAVDPKTGKIIRRDEYKRSIGTLGALSSDKTIRKENNYGFTFKPVMDILSQPRTKEDDDELTERICGIEYCSDEYRKKKLSDPKYLNEYIKKRRRLSVRSYIREQKEIDFFKPTNIIECQTNMLGCIKCMYFKYGIPPIDCSQYKKFRLNEFKVNHFRIHGY